MMMMILLPWRRRRSSGGGEGNRGFVGMNGETELTIPPYFICPITLDLMKDPVTLPTGVTYDRESIEKWIESGNVTCPVTNQIVNGLYPIPNHAIRKMIQNWCVENKSRGVDRIPTPRVPITPHEICEIRLKMEAVVRNGDAGKFRDLVGKVRNWGMESERNRDCIIGNGIGSVLADGFRSFASGSEDRVDFELLKEILSLLTWAFPFGSEGVSHLKSPVSLRFIVGFLKEEENDVSAKENAVSVLKHLVSVDDGVRLEMEGIEEALVNALNFSPKKTLAIIHHILASSSERTVVGFIETGLIPLLLEILIDGDRIICERGLGILDRILGFEQGIQGVRRNALAVPLLVKKISRVSDAATELCVSCIWKMGEAVLDEAVKLGAFQKLLVVLQIGCGGGTKEKASELLKMMNSKHADEIQCFESPSMGFQYVKRS